MNSNKKIFIDEMISARCVILVKELLSKLKMPFIRVTVGEVEFIHNPDHSDLMRLCSELRELGLRCISTDEEKRIAGIKRLVQNAVNQLQGKTWPVVQKELRTQLEVPFYVLDKQFRQQHNGSIHYYFIHYRIEKIKELLLYNELSLKQIAFKLGFSSIHHLSSQFSKIVGVSPTLYKRNNLNLRCPVNKIVLKPEFSNN